MTRHAFLIGTLALIFATYISSELHNFDSEHVAEVSIPEDIIHFSQQLATEWGNKSFTDGCIHCFWPTLKRASYAISLNQDGWTMTLDLQ